MATSDSDTPHNPRLIEAFRHSGIPPHPPAGILYHYTSAAGLNGILTSGHIYASHVDFLNDTTEWHYGKELVLACATQLIGGPLAFWSSIIETTLNHRLGGELFATCFCEVDDLLPQWKGYANGGSGYSIGFRTTTLSPGGSSLLLPVVYGEEAATLRCTKILSWTQAEAIKLADRDPLSPAMADLFSIMTTVLFLCAATTKKHLFAHEREWRHLHFEPDSTDLSGIHFRDVGGLLVPYVDIILPTKPGTACLDVSSVRCGPSLQDVATEHAVRMLLAKCGLSDASVSRSDVPLRR